MLAQSRHSQIPPPMKDHNVGELNTSRLYNTILLNSLKHIYTINQKVHIKAMKHLPEQLLICHHSFPTIFRQPNRFSNESKKFNRTQISAQVNG